MKPKPQEIEISIFGPGYGECIVIHVGSGKWAIIDSCLDKQSNPVSITYLESLGVNVESDVISVSASHWHDDHVKGLAKTIEACESARFSLGAALQTKEFVAFLIDHEAQHTKLLDKGGTELLRCLQLMAEGRRVVSPLMAGTLIFDFDPGELEHKKRVELRALSPSGKQYTDFLKRIDKFYQSNHLVPKVRINDPNPNHLSVAMLLTIGNQSVLLGADLEQERDPNKGWNAVLGDRQDRSNRSHIFKIPHHGSKNAHNDVVWKKMIKQPTWSVVTPWVKGGNNLPLESDIKRMKGFPQNTCHITSTGSTQSSYRADRETNKLIKKTGTTIDRCIFSDGRVSYRWVPGDKSPDVKLSGSANQL